MRGGDKGFSKHIFEKKYILAGIFAEFVVADESLFLFYKKMCKALESLCLAWGVIVTRHSILCISTWVMGLSNLCPFLWPFCGAFSGFVAAQ